MTAKTILIRKIYARDKEAPPIQISSAVKGFVDLSTNEKDTYWGRVQLTLPADVAHALGQALIDAACESNKD